jgi:NAD(P)-dependent dehydrogenase (short-subunit alcohol dehydrogenase family)
MKRVLVTGAARGIGRAVAEAFAAQGDQLLLMDIDEAGLNAATAELRARGATVEAGLGSVANAAHCEAVAALAGRTMGGLDVLSHNAGIQTYGTVETTDEELWDRTLDINLKGAYLMSRAVMPMLRESRGAVVHMTSVQGQASQAGVTAYSVSKHGLIGLVRSMAVDYAPHGVRINGVAPGSVDTPLLRNALALAEDPEAIMAEIRNMHPLGRPATPAEIAAAVVFLASDGASFITGSILNVDGGLRATLGGSPKKQ